MPDLSPHRRVPARQSERSPNRALPASPPRGTRTAFPVGKPASGSSVPGVPGRPRLPRDGRFRHALRWADIGESAFALQLAPAAGPVVGHDLPEHGGEGGRIDGFALADGHGAGGLVVLAAGDDSIGIRDDAAVVEKNVDVVLRRQQRTDVALQHEVGMPEPPDGSRLPGGGGPGTNAYRTAHRPLPVRQGTDIGVATR